jgi:hypothetical protein
MSAIQETILGNQNEINELLIPSYLENIVDKKINNAALSCFEKFVDWFLTVFSCFYPSYNRFYCAQLQGSITPPTLPPLTIKGNPRAGNPMEIIIPIGNVSHLALTEENLSEIFQLANQHTLNQPYAIDISRKQTVQGKTIYRPNHNGTHSARQVRHLEALFDLIQNRGSEATKAVYNTLTSEEILNLRLGAYFLRAGRVDETSHKCPPADDYYTRSALIYEQYAKQLRVDGATIQWVKKLLINSCKPEGVREADIDTDPKNTFGYEVLTMVHELDLIRCFDEANTKKTIASMRGRLDYFVSDQEMQKDAIMDQFMEFAKDLCETTGSYRAYDKHRGDIDLFVECSIDGALCWEKVESLAIPAWH